MTNKQESKLNMYSTVISFCDLNLDLIASIPALQTAYTAYKDAVTRIDNFSRNEKFALPGIVQNKKQLRENLARITASIASNLFAYAEETGKEELKSLTRFTITDLLKYKDKDLPGICRGIAATAWANLSGLASYNITEATIKELNDALEEYEASAPLPRAAATALSTNLKSFDVFFKTADRILKNRMDRIINPLKVSHPEFHQSYFSNRIIIDTYTTSTQIKGTITAKDTKEPIRDVTITALTNGTKVSSNADGKFVVRPLSSGIHSIQAIKEGYQPLTIEDIDVKRGKIKKIDLVMIRKLE